MATVLAVSGLQSCCLVLTSLLCAVSVGGSPRSKHVVRSRLESCLLKKRSGMSDKQRCFARRSLAKIDALQTPIQLQKSLQ